MIILLFDIDGTLILSGGAGVRGMNRAFAKLFNVENALNGILVSGRTDKIIFRNACEKANIAFSETRHTKFKEKYLKYLNEEIEKPCPNKCMLPGVKDLLNILQKDAGVKLGLLTGNYARGAKIKLGHFNLDHFFEFGAYGDDEEDRNKLPPYALMRYKEKFDQNGFFSSAWVIGDTPNDVECARTHGAKAIAVATGGYEKEDLENAEPDVLLTNLADSYQFLEIIKNSA